MFIFLKGIDTLSRETTLLKLFYLLFAKGSTFKGKNLLQLGKKCLSYKEWQKIYQKYSFPLWWMDTQIDSTLSWKDLSPF